MKELPIEIGVSQPHDSYIYILVCTYVLFVFVLCVWMCFQALDILKTADVHRGKENRIQRDGTNEQRDIKKPS